MTVEKKPPEIYELENSPDASHNKAGFYSREGTFIVCEPNDFTLCAQYLLTQNSDYFQNKPSISLFGNHSPRRNEDSSSLTPIEQLMQHGYIKIDGSKLEINSELSGLQYHQLEELGYDVPPEFKHDYLHAFGWDKLPQDTHPSQSAQEILDLLSKFLTDPYQGVQTASTEYAREFIKLLSSSTNVGTKIDNADKERSNRYYLDPSGKYCFVITARVDNTSDTGVVFNFQTLPLADLERSQSMNQYIKARS